MKRSLVIVICCLIGMVGCATTSERASDAEKSGNLLEAAKLYERNVDEWLDKGYNWGHELNKPADIYAKLGKYDEAIRVYKKSISFNSALTGSKSGLQDARLGLAKVYVARGSAQDAAAEIGAVVNDCMSTSYDAFLTYGCESVLPEARALIVGNLDLIRRLDTALANATAQGRVERAKNEAWLANREASAAEREALAREDKRREDQQTAIRRQEVFSAVTSAAQGLGAQQRTNSALDAQAKADAARRAAEQDRAQRSTGVNEKTVTSPATNYSSSGQPATTGSTASQMHSGSARDMTSGNIGGTTGRPNQGTVTGAQSTGNQTIGTAKFHSQDATACMEIVPSGFKCNGPNKRFLVNNCSMKVYVWFKSSGPSGSEGLDSWAPKQCRSIAADLFDGSETRVEWKACSWDPKATFGPSKDPCRY